MNFGWQVFCSYECSYKKKKKIVSRKHARKETGSRPYWFEAASFRVASLRNYYKINSLKPVFFQHHKSLSTMTGPTKKSQETMPEEKQEVGHIGLKQGVSSQVGHFQNWLGINHQELFWKCSPRNLFFFLASVDLPITRRLTKKSFSKPCMKINRKSTVFGFGALSSSEVW